VEGREDGRGESAVFEERSGGEKAIQKFSLPLATRVLDPCRSLALLHDVAEAWALAHHYLSTFLIIIVSSFIGHKR
jgi:hypothetical protein